MMGALRFCTFSFEAEEQSSPTDKPALPAGRDGAGGGRPQLSTRA